MTYEESPAVPGLGLACLWAQSVVGPGAQLVVPDACMDIIWAGGGIAVAGPDTVSRMVEMRAGTRLHAVRFAPGVAPHVLGVPAAALRDVTVDLAELWRGRAHRIAETPGDRRLVLQQAVAERLREVGPPDPSIAPTVRALARGVRVAETARSLGLSDRQLRRRCLAAFGYGPKTLQRILRFQRALRRARAGSPFADIAYAEGYADQAHLAKEVRELAGTPLSNLL